MCFPFPSTYLERLDPSRNMARYYLLAIQPNLFGEVSFIRQWGRIGARGRQTIELMSDLAGAEAAYTKLERAKRRRGYHAAGPSE